MRGAFYRRQRREPRGNGLQWRLLLAGSFWECCLRPMTFRYIILLAGVVVLTLTSCKNPTAVNAVRQMNRDAERTGSPYRFRAHRVPGGTAVTRYRIIPPKP